MSDATVHTTQLRGWLERLKAGDLSAREEMVRATCNRLERLARKMLRGSPSVRPWVQTNDVLQSALMRLLRSLEVVEPGSMRDFYGLAATQIRRELLDLARHFSRANRLGAAPQGGGTPDDSVADPEPVAPAEDTHELEKWERFHENWAKLPVEEREVVGLTFYHGLTQPEVAEVLVVTVRTVQRRWQAALVRLQRSTGD